MIGNKIIKFNKIDSTNTFIRNNIHKLNHGDVVFSKTQSKGKGRHGNPWVSEEGNLYFSFLLKEDLKRSEIFTIIMKSSVAIIKLLTKYGIDAKIKYPNDIVVEKQKISGILIESIGYNDINNLIIGIGINVNQMKFDNIDIKATSMAKETNRNFNIDNLLDEFIELYNGSLDSYALYQQYLDYSIIINLEVNYNNTEYIVKNILKNGNILLENENLERIVDYGNINFSNYYSKK